MTAKASSRMTMVDIVKALQLNSKKQYGILRQNATGISSAETGDTGISSGGQPVTAPLAGLLKTQGDTMIGPIAYFTRLPAIADLPTVGNNNTLTISNTSSGYSSHIVWGAGGSDQMDIIAGAAFTGQVLVIESAETLTQTITDKSNVTGPPAGNIKTLDGNDLVLGTAKTLVMFMFSNIDNTWHQVSNPTIGGGGVQASDSVVWTGVSHTWTGTTFAVNSANITLGDGITDEINFLGRIGAIGPIPIVGNVTDLGAPTKEYADAYINRIASNVTFTGAVTNINSSSIRLGDGTSDQIDFLGRIGNTGLIPVNDAQANLGVGSKRWFQIAGINIVGTNVTATGILSANGTVFLGNNTSDNITITGRIASNVQPNADNSRALGASSLRWALSFFTKIDINAGNGPALTVDAGSSSNEAIRINGTGGIIRFDGNAISLSASAGFQTLPAKPVAFLNIKVGGSNMRIPYYTP